MTGAAGDKPRDIVLDPARHPWMREEWVATVMRTLNADGGEARFVGGAVRDAILGKPVQDLDIATTLLPADSSARLDAAGVKVVPTGIAHGTVTAVAGGRAMEITTLRRDVETDGRHAVVAFTDDWNADAARRDLTINALSADMAGHVHDPFDGLGDLRAGRVRFVGDAGTRIDEDVLRLLRFFRFHAWYGRGRPDPDGLEAAIARRGRLSSLSMERVRSEILRLLEAPDPAPTVAIMEEGGILQPVLAEPLSCPRLARLVDLEPDKPDPILRLAALARRPPAKMGRMARCLRCSRAEQRRLVALGTAQADIGEDRRSIRRAIRRTGDVATYRDLALLEAADGCDASKLSARLGIADEWETPIFPLRGADVKARGVASGPEVGRVLKAVEKWWIETDFEADRAACLARLDEITGGTRS